MESFLPNIVRNHQGTEEFVRVIEKFEKSIIRVFETLLYLQSRVTKEYMIMELFVRLKSKRQRINTVTFYLRVFSTPQVGVVFKHIVKG